MQLGDYGGRYVKYPLSKLLNANNGTLHLAIVGTNASRPPTGKIEISRISLGNKAARRPALASRISFFRGHGPWVKIVRWHLERP